MTARKVGGAATDGLTTILGPISEDLAAVEKILGEIIKAPSRQVRPLVEHIQKYRGKRLRPGFTILAGRCFRDVSLPHHQLGAIVELIHTATLVHDDVLDKADKRRGLSTVNDGWGNHTAVLLGDYLFATAFALSASLENPLASRYLSWIAGVVCQGEMLQNLESGNLDLDEQTYLDLIEKKTAYLFAASARVGAVYSGASDKAAEALGRYGMSLGTAFQIVDDCLDLEGDEDRVGKTLGTDALQGKATLPVIQYLRTAGESDARHLRDLLGGGDGDAHREEIQSLLLSSGAMAWAKERAVFYVEQGLECLAEIPDSPYRQALIQLAEYTLARQR